MITGQIPCSAKIWLFAEIDVEQEPSEARHTSMGLSNLLKDRRPDTYGELTKLSKYSFMGGEGVTGTR